MPEIVVTCGGLARPPRRKVTFIDLDVSPDAEPDKRLQLDCASITRALADDIPPVIADLLEIATYVYSADRLSSRGSTAMPHMGADWRRRFHFVVPVRRPDVWHRPDVNETLVRTLAFLSEDSFAFTFDEQPWHLGSDPYLGIDQPEASSIVPDDVMLFSGGLDSLAGAIECLRAGRKVALVAHQSSTYVAGRQKELADELKARYPGSVYFAPVWVRKGDQQPGAGCRPSRRHRRPAGEFGRAFRSRSGASPSA